MKNKMLIELVVPIIEEKYDVYVPINKKIGNVIQLLAKAVNELSGGYYQYSEGNALYSGETGECYQMDVLVRNTDIRNGSKLVLM